MRRTKPLPVPVEEAPVVLHTERLSCPLSWVETFGRPGPIELEVGSGKGLFLREASSLQPESNFIGIERAGKWFHRSVQRILAANCPNVLLVRADAFDFLLRWVPPGSLSGFHVYFPDPWPKNRHARRRLLQPALYQLAARGLGPAGMFYLASDVGPYFSAAVQEILQTGLFRQIAWAEDSPDRLLTSYARKYLLEGRTLHYAKFVRQIEGPC